MVGGIFENSFKATIPGVYKLRLLLFTIDFSLLPFVTTEHNK